MTRRITISPRHPSKGKLIERGRVAREEFIPPPLRVTVTRVGCVAVKVIARYAEDLSWGPAALKSHLGGGGAGAKLDPGFNKHPVSKVQPMTRNLLST